MKGDLKKKKVIQTTTKKETSKKLVKSKISSSNTKRPLVIAKNSSEVQTDTTKPKEISPLPSLKQNTTIQETKNNNSPRLVQIQARRVSSTMKNIYASDNGRNGLQTLKQSGDNSPLE